MSADAAKEEKKQSNTSANSQQKKGGRLSLQYIHSTPEAIQQRKLQDLADQSAPLRKAINLQKLADQCPQVQKLAKLQSITRFALMPEHEGATPGPEPPDTSLASPAILKAGDDSPSGLSLEQQEARVTPSRLTQRNALAFDLGTPIGTAWHEISLPRPAWPVAQQAQDRVEPAIQRQDDAGLALAGDGERKKEMVADWNSQFVQKQEETPGLQQANVVQRIEIVGKFNNPSHKLSEIDEGVYGADQPIAHSDVKCLTEGINDHLMDYYNDNDEVDEVDEQEIVILTGCHGDQLGNLIYNEDNFHKEDVALMSRYAFVKEVVDMQALSRKQQVEEMSQKDHLLILSWCYSAMTYKNLDSYDIVGEERKGGDDAEISNDVGSGSEEESVEIDHDVPLFNRFSVLDGLADDN